MLEHTNLDGQTAIHQPDPIILRTANQLQLVGALSSLLVSIYLL